MRIAILVEGRTEKAFKPTLVAFLKGRLEGRMPKLDFMPQNGCLPTGDKLKRLVDSLLRSNDAIIALTDVYTGKADFNDADDAKRKMRQWIGGDERFHAHVALHDFEAWLLPYWERIRKLSGANRACPSGLPETLNHGNPPAYRLNEIFRTGSGKRCYSKIRDGQAILKDQDLSIAANACPELKAFLNTILRLSGGAPLE